MLAPERSLAWVGLHRPAVSLDGRPVQHFEDSDDFLLSGHAHGFEACVVESRQRGVAALDLLRLIRRRSEAALLLLSEDPSAVLVAALNAGADMVLPLDSPSPHLEAALAAVERRRRPVRAASAPWVLDAARNLLVAPDGTAIALTETDLVILQACAEAPQRRVARELLLQRLWGADSVGMDNALHATVYRLRKRIEKNGALISPLQALPRVGYEFRAPLQPA